MAYTKIQCIAHKLNTSPIKATATANPYYPGLANVQQDINARVALVECALKAALSTQKIAGADTLKVFLMPEFFFRGITGAYNMDSVQFAINALQVLAKQKDNAQDDRGKWCDWVFCFGTVLGGSQRLAKDLSWVEWFLDKIGLSNEGQVTDIYNFALVQRGGVAPADGDSHAILKEALSTIDFIRTDQVKTNLPLVPPDLLLLENVRYMSAGAKGVGRESQSLGYDGNGIFDCAGFRFGMEICLDHLNHRLTGSPQIPGDTQVQIQLAPSCGASFEQESMIVGAGGYVFACDGLREGVSLHQNSAPPANFKRTVVNVPDATVTVNGANIAIKDLYGPSVGDVLGDQPASEAGCVVCYEPAPAPLPGKVLGWSRTFQWKDKDYVIEVVLIYTGQNMRFSAARGRITNAKLGLNNLSRPLPMELTKAVAQGPRQALRLSLTTGRGGYVHAISCESTLTGLAMSGLSIEFGDLYTDKPKTTWIEIKPAP